MNRFAENRVVLKDGTVIPKNSKVSVLADNLRSEGIYESPDTFDGKRFLNLRSQPGQENNWQFVTTSTNHAGFGHGIHACPGRFFASNEVKVALCWMLLKYDWKLEEGAEPSIFAYGGEIISNPENKVLIRRRQEELDLASLYKAEF